MPTVWLLGCEAVEPTEVGGYLAPKGHTLWKTQLVLHPGERLFEASGQFLPERSADGLARRIIRYAYLPFGGGPRISIGTHFTPM